MAHSVTRFAGNRADGPSDPMATPPVKTGLAIACAPAIKSPPYGLSPRNAMTFRPAAAQRSRRKRGALVGVAACALCARQIGLVVGAGIEHQPADVLSPQFPAPRRITPSFSKSQNSKDTIHASAVAPARHTAPLCSATLP